MKNVVASWLTFLAFAASTAQASAPPPSAHTAAKEGIELPGGVSPEITDATPVFLESAGGIELAGSTSSTLPTPNAISTLYTRQVTTAAQHEVETGIMALNIGGVDHTIGCFMNNYDGFPDPTGNWEIRTRKTTDFETWTERVPAKPASATRTVDPVLSANVYANGVSPLTVYLGGLGTSTCTPSNCPRKIAVWRSTDGANTWSSPVTVAQSTTRALRVDKPTIAVSWHQPTRGYVFVAYILARLDSSRSQNELFVARSTDGGATFNTPIQVAQSYLHAPQVLVSSATGNVYVVYLDYDLNMIRMATSTNQGSTWTIENVTSPTGKFLDVLDDFHIYGGAMCSLLQAVTVPHARFNWVRGSIGIVWHERESANPMTTTDVWFIAKTASGWTNKIRINPTQTNDQWMPALDFDSTGNYVVVYYDRSADPSNLLFKETWAQIDPVYPTPSVLASGLVQGAVASNPGVFPVNGACFKGEYQDIWYWPYSDAMGGRFNSFWTGVTSRAVYDNVFISGLK